MATTISVDNRNLPAPRWFRKLKKALGVFTLTANVMVQQWGLPDPLLVAHIQLWCTIGIGAAMEIMEILLTDPDEKPLPPDPPKP